MTHLDINLIVARHFGTTPEKLLNDHRSDGRKAAMMICKEVLKASTIKLARWYGKHQHTTPMRTLRTGNNLLNTEAFFQKNYNLSLAECQAMYKLYLLEQKALMNAELEKKTIKQIYNLNHRVREKGISVRTRSRTLSCTEDEFFEMKDSQLKKLLDTHHYAIQLSIL